MSTPHAQERLESIFEEVKAAFPYYDEEKQAEIAMKRFEEELVLEHVSLCLPSHCPCRAANT